MEQLLHKVPMPFLSKCQINSACLCEVNVIKFHLLFWSKISGKFSCHYGVNVRQIPHTLPPLPLLSKCQTNYHCHYGANAVFPTTAEIRKEVSGQSFGTPPPPRQRKYRIECRGAVRIVGWNPYFQGIWGWKKLIWFFLGILKCQENSHSHYGLNIRQMPALGSKSQTNSTCYQIKISDKFHLSLWSNSQINSAHHYGVICQTNSTCTYRIIIMTHHTMR